MSPYIRQNRTIIRISGKDAQKLLNDVLSSEFQTDNNLAKWWALLSPQGKIQAEGLGHWYENAFWLDIDKSTKDSFLKRMHLYKMRAEVEFEDLSNSHIVAFSKQNPIFTNSFVDPRDKNLAFHIFISKEKAENFQSDSDKFIIERINLAISELGADYEPDSLFPHDIGMDLLAGVDFSKGCYIGQEIVSRMQHKANIKRRVLIASNVETSSGAILTINDKKIGFLGQVINKKAIAFVRLDKLDDKKKAQADNMPVQLETPKWANYQI